MLLTLLLAVQSPSVVLTGRALGPEGQPLAAHVVVGGYDNASGRWRSEVVAAATAGTDGVFSLELPGSWIERQLLALHEVNVFAYLVGYGIAVQQWSAAEIPVGFEIELRLPAATADRIRFVDPDGKPISGGRVWPEGLSDRVSNEIHMPAAWWREHAVTTDADGWATLCIARRDLYRLGFEVEGHGTQEFARHWATGAPLPDELEAFQIEERVLRFEGQVPIGATLVIENYGFAERDSDRDYTRRFEWRSRVESDAPLHVFAPPGVVEVRFSTTDASGLASGWCKFQPDGEITLTPAKTFRFRGRTVSEPDGSPLGGVKLFVRGFHSGWVESGPDGRFEFDSVAPAIELGALVPPQGFANVEARKQYRIGNPQEEYELDIGDVPVPPTWTATGVVRGPDGAPLAGAWVVAESRTPEGLVVLSAVTDAEGQYVLAGARQGTALDVSARRGDLAGKARQKENAPFELSLSRTASARGVARMTDGAAAAGVVLEVWRVPPGRRPGTEELVAIGGHLSVTTSADGSFETLGALAVDEKYCLVWSGEHVERGRSAWFTGAELDRGVEIEMQRLQGVRGVIRRADGTPLAGAAVRLRRGGVARVTDEHGEFEVPGVHASGDALIVVDPDGAPQVRWIAPGAADLDWRLLPRADEQPLAPAPEHARARELELALELLEKNYAEAIASKDESKILRAVESLAWADPALVLERVEAGLFETAWMRDFSLGYVAEALLTESPTEALAVSMRLDRGMSRSLAMLEAAAHLDAAAEREQLALIRAEARAVDPPEHRVVVLAHLADRLLDLGERDMALDVLAEGREVANALPAADSPGYARSRFGEVLARVDPAAGRALIDQLASAEDRPRHLFNTAHELAASDPAAAEALMVELAKNRASLWSPDTYAARIAHRMAPVDLERARKLAGRFDRTGFADGMIALALADQDPAEARASLEVAFRRAEELALHGRPQSNERSIATAAALLPVAERVDPARLRAYAARALAVRRQDPLGPFSGDDRGWNEDAALAFYVARWEPEVARGLLEPAIAAARGRTDYALRGEIDLVWAAAAVVDPEWAASIARELGGRARSQIGLVLALPPTFRTMYCQERILGFWVVGKEDL